jgi:hypothetical protein
MGKKVIAALVGIDKSDVPPELTDEQYIDLTGDADAYKRLKEGLKRAGLDPTTFPFPSGRRPYPGFAYLEEDDPAVFFGRNAQIVAWAGPDPQARAHGRDAHVGDCRRVWVGQVVFPARGPLATLDARRPGVAAAPGRAS